MPTPTLTTLVSFNGTNGSAPENFLVADTAGDLFGTTGEDGPGGSGTVFEIAKTSTGYASTPTTLMSVSSSSEPSGDLLMDAAGDLVGRRHDGAAQWRNGSDRRFRSRHRCSGPSFAAE